MNFFRNKLSHSMVFLAFILPTQVVRAQQQTPNNSSPIKQLTEKKYLCVPYTTEDNRSECFFPALDNLNNGIFMKCALQEDAKVNCKIAKMKTSYNMDSLRKSCKSEVVTKLEALKNDFLTEASLQIRARIALLEFRAIRSATSWHSYLLSLQGFLWDRGFSDYVLNEGTMCFILSQDLSLLNTMPKPQLRKSTKVGDSVILALGGLFFGGPLALAGLGSAGLVMISDEPKQPEGALITQKEWEDRERIRQLKSIQRKFNLLGNKLTDQDIDRILEQMDN